MTALAPLGVAFGPVDVGPRGAVDHDASAGATDRALDRLGIGDVDVLVREGHDVDVGGRRVHEVLAQHSSGAGYEEARGHP